MEKDIMIPILKFHIYGIFKGKLKFKKKFRFEDLQNFPHLHNPLVTETTQKGI